MGRGGAAPSPKPLPLWRREGLRVDKMVGDPNWLYSTIAQSSAAIVAIIGGFITATILARRAEKTSLLNELSDKKEQLKEFETMYLIPKRKLTDQQRQNMIEKDIEKQDKIASLKYGISNLESRLKAFAYPPHLGWGLVILGCFAFSSIVLPVMVIAIGIYSDQLASFTFILFFLGLAVVCGYIAFQIRERRRK